MTEAQIKLKRTESILCELIPEALSSLNDKRLHEIDVIEVKCSKGRNDAKVFLDPSYFSDEEQRIYIKLLKKARPIVENYCLKDQGWYKCPKLTFEFDESIEKRKVLEKLFEQIAQERKS